MICELLAMAEIADELNDMDKGDESPIDLDRYSVRCSALTRQATRLFESMYRYGSRTSEIRDLFYGIIGLADRLNFHFWNREHDQREKQKSKFGIKVSTR